MSRKIKVEDEKWGEYELFVLWEDEEGEWADQEWQEIRELEEVQPLLDLFSRVSQSAYRDALNGHPIHLIRELDLNPEACLIKGDLPVSKCFFWEKCPAYQEEKCFGHKDPPPCYNSTVEDISYEVRETVSDIYRMWQNGIWIIIVEEDKVT